MTGTPNTINTSTVIHVHIVDTTKKLIRVQLSVALFLLCMSVSTTSNIHYGLIRQYVTIHSFIKFRALSPDRPVLTASDVAKTRSPVFPWEDDPL